MKTVETLQIVTIASSALIICGNGIHYALWIDHVPLASSQNDTQEDDGIPTDHKKWIKKSERRMPTNEASSRMKRWIVRETKVKKTQSPQKSHWKDFQGLQYVGLIAGHVRRDDEI